jgi:hypothetical protein
MAVYTPVKLCVQKQAAAGFDLWAFLFLNSSRTPILLRDAYSTEGLPEHWFMMCVTAGETLKIFIKI